MLSVKEEKAAIRQRIAGALQAISEQERVEGGRSVCLKLLQADLWAKSRFILLFSPLPDEMDLSLLVRAHPGKRVGLPRYNKKTRCYEAVEVCDWSIDVAPGYFGIREPKEHCALIDLNQLDLVIVPGVAFDLSGSRLGRGKGYYDRLLAAVAGFKCGIAFDVQVLERLPLEPHDMRLDCILTPTRWLFAGQQPV